MNEHIARFDPSRKMDPNRVYDRSIPSRIGTVEAITADKLEYLVKWPDGEEEWRDVDSLGAVPLEVS